MSTDVVDRYERIAEGYRHWAVVLHPGGVRLLDRVEARLPALVAGEAARILDVGCGTGSQLLPAAQRWVGAQLVGLDAAGAMLAQAKRAAEQLRPDVATRVEFVQADAAAIPFPDETFDVVISAFVVQLVPDRTAVLAEMHRVLKPGGVLGIDGWVESRNEMPFEPEEAFEQTLSELGIEREPRDEHRAGDFRSVRGAANELRRAGFRRVSATPDALDHRWTPESYAAYKRASRERDLYESIEPELADRLADDFRARLDRLFEADPELFRFQPPIVSIVAVRE